MRYVTLVIAAADQSFDLVDGGSPAPAFGVARNTIKRLAAATGRE